MKKYYLPLMALFICCTSDAFSFWRKKKQQSKNEQPHVFKELAQLAQAEPPTDLDIEAPTSDSELEQQIAEILESSDAETPAQEPTPVVPEVEEEVEITEKLPIPEKTATPAAAQMAKPLKPSVFLTFDIDKKKQEVVTLVEEAAKALRKRQFDKACHAFSHTKEFIKGELYVFLFDMKGTCFAHGEDPQLIWKNLIDLTDWVGTPIVKEILKSARHGGGWVTYGWHNATKISYIQQVEKDGKVYAIGCGFYPQSKKEAVVNLVKGAVALFTEVKEAGRPADWAFSRMSYPSGQFVSGNLYVYALDFSGNIYAQGERPGLIGTNSWNYRDSKGKYVNREIVNKLKTATKGVWVSYISKRAQKEAYAEKVVDAHGKEYFIACGFYPEANRERVEDLVRKGYQFMKSSGKSAAIDEFSSRQSNDYRYGDLFLVVYGLTGKMKGKIIAHGGNADAIGVNALDEKDDDDRPYIKELLNRATTTGIWMNAKVKGAFQSTFAAQIDLGVDSFVIACSYYPVSKPETLTLLVQSAESFLKDNPREEAFAMFVSGDGNFRRGDLQIFALGEEGLCYAYGDDYNLIWRNIIKLQDDEGRPFVKMIINAASKGPNFLEVKLNQATKALFVMPVTKEGKKYIVGSGFYH